MTRPIWVDPDIAAHATEVKVKTLNAWVHRGYIPARDPAGKYDLTAIFTFIESRGSSRAAMAKAARARRLRNPGE